jgi:hypothetical protein
MVLISFVHMETIVRNVDTVTVNTGTVDTTNMAVAVVVGHPLIAYGTGVGRGGVVLSNLCCEHGFLNSFRCF